MSVYKSPCGRIEIRLGRWQDVLCDITECDALITDPPYSERTHAGQRTGSETRKPTIAYESLTNDGVTDLAAGLHKRTKHWAAIFCDHLGFVSHETCWDFCGWYTFAPVLWLTDTPPPRLAGDGPCNAAEYLMIARPRIRLEADRTGSRPGRYMVRGRYSCDAPAGIAGQKNLDGMRALIKDYTLPGDLICDPFAGSGTTLLAAAIEGRRAIGAERDPKTFDLAVRRLSAGYTPATLLGAIKPRQARLI